MTGMWLMNNGHTESMSQYRRSLFYCLHINTLKHLSFRCPNPYFYTNAMFLETHCILHLISLPSSDPKALIFFSTMVLYHSSCVQSIPGSQCVYPSATLCLVLCWIFFIIILEKQKWNTPHVSTIYTSIHSIVSPVLLTPPSESEVCLIAQMGRTQQHGPNNDTSLVNPYNMHYNLWAWLRQIVFTVCYALYVCSGSNRNQVRGCNILTNTCLLSIKSTQSAYTRISRPGRQK